MDIGNPVRKRFIVPLREPIRAPDLPKPPLPVTKPASEPVKVPEPIE
jgi:hypothetical protein